MYTAIYVLQWTGEAEINEVHDIVFSWEDAMEKIEEAFTTTIVDSIHLELWERRDDAKDCVFARQETFYRDDYI